MSRCEVRAVGAAGRGARLRLFGLVTACVAVGLLAEPGVAQDRIDVDVIVSHISSQPGKIDPRGRRIDEKLRSQIRYQSLRVLQQQRLDLRINEIGSMDLPNRRKLRLRAMDVGERGVLLAVEVEGSLDSDLRIPNHHLVVFGTESYEGGKLVISLEPSW